MTDAYTLDKWKKVKTVGDYLDLLEDPNTNWQNLLDTFIEKINIDTNFVMHMSLLNIIGTTKRVLTKK